MDTSKDAPEIPDYVLIRQIGRGSYGDVWLGHGITGVFRAIKIIYKSRFAEARPYFREFEGITRFAALSQKEPAQLGLMHAGRNDAADFFYYVMELADDAQTGREILPERYVPLTLKERLLQQRLLPATEALSVSIHLARALAGLHTAGLVHRDIKPSNVIFVGGVPKLADIGLVSDAGAQATFVGTEGFIAPEGSGSPAADVYSLGKVMYEMVSGRDRNDFPLLPETFHELEDKTELLELNEVLLKACEASRERRFADASAVLDELLLLQAGKSVRRLRRAERRSTQVARFALVLGAVAILGLAGAYTERLRASNETKLRLRAEAQRDIMTKRLIYSADLTQAQSQINAGELVAARQLLDHAATNLPGKREQSQWPFELAVLSAQADGAPYRTVWQGKEQASSVVAGTSAPLRMALRCDGDEALVLSASDKSETTIRRISGVHRATGLSTDAKQIVGTDIKYSSASWDLMSGTKRIGSADGARHWPVAVVNDRLVGFVEGLGGPASWFTWNFQDSAAEERLALDQPEERGGEFYCAAQADQNNLCALVLVHGRGPQARWSLHILNTLTGTRIYHEKLSRAIRCLTFHPNGSYIECAFSEKVLKFDVSAKRWSEEAVLTSTNLQQLAFSPDGHFLAARDGSAKITVFPSNHSGNRPFRILNNNKGPVTYLAWTGKSTLLATLGSGLCAEYNISESPNLDRYSGFWVSPSGGPNLCVDPFVPRIAASLDGNATRMISVGSDETLDILAVVQPVCFSGHELCGFTKDGSWLRYDLSRAKTIAEDLPWPANLTRSQPSFNRASRLVSFGDADGNIYLFSLTAPRDYTKILTHTGAVWWTALSDDGHFGASSGEDRSVVIFDAKTGQKLAAVPQPQGIFAGAFSPASGLLAAGREDGTVEIIDCATMRSRQILRTTRSHLRCVSFSRDGSRLLVGGESSSISVIDTDDWHEIGTVSCCEDPAQKGSASVDLIECAGVNQAYVYLTNGTIVILPASTSRDEPVKGVARLARN